MPAARSENEWCWWNWCCPPDSLDTSFVVWIVSGRALVCGFGNALRIQAYGSGLGHGFVFGESLWLRVYGSASGICLDVWEAFPMQEYNDRKGSGTAARESGKKEKGCKRGLYRKETYADVVSSSVCFPFVSPEVLIGGGKSHIQ